MSTNFYLKRKIPPEQAYDYFHLAKLTNGNAIIFAENPKAEEREREQLEIENFGDVCALIKSGEYEIANEYGDAISWEEFCTLLEPDRQARHGVEYDFRAGDWF